jgi:hypothetical protein
LDLIFFLVDNCMDSDFIPIGNFALPVQRDKKQA